MNETIETMASHASVRKFEDRDIPKELLEKIINAARQASTSSNLQAYSIIVIKDKAKKEKLSELCGNQVWVNACPVFLVICPDLRRLEKVCLRQGYDFLDSYIEMFILATVDAALVAQNILLGAESVDLGGVMIGGIRNNPDGVSELLNLPDKVYPLMGLCLGYPDQIPMIKPRLQQGMVVHKEQYDDSKFEKFIDEYEDFIRQTGLYDGPHRKVKSPIRQEPDARQPGKEVPDEKYSWCEHTARRLAADAPDVLRPHLREFLLKKKFGLG